MAHIIAAQNADIKQAWDRYPGRMPINNHTLAYILGIEEPVEEYFQDYNKSDIGVKVI